MSPRILSVASVTSLALFLTGCGSAQNGTPTAAPNAQHADHGADSEKAECAAAFAKLSDEDRPLVEAQGYCVVTSEPLGSMGPPLKLIVNEQPVFVCCKGCEKKAKSNPDKTLAKVEELKAKVKSESSN
ncbi:MAG: hypothetical protein NT013_30460 [Planctomycetia bacterium]|nr:hypothetical protein [Planctomycetia bacterium]